MDHDAREQLITAMTGAAMTAVTQLRGTQEFYWGLTTTNSALDMGNVFISSHEGRRMVVVSHREVGVIARVKAQLVKAQATAPIPFQVADAAYGQQLSITLI